MSSWRSNLTLAAVMGAVTLGVVLGVGEMALRARERHRASLGGTIPLLFYQHGRLGYALVHDFDYFGWIHIDHQGFRGPNVDVEKKPGVVRIMAVGSSTTFDPGVSDDAAAWPARLQYWLGQLAPADTVEVINAGVPGYHAIEDVIRLETELYQYHPDLILLYEGHNDLFGSLRKGREGEGPASETPGEVPVVTPWAHWLSQHSLLYGKLLGRVKVLSLSAAAHRSLAQGTGGPSDDEILQAGADAFARNISFFLAVARELRIPVVVVELLNASGVGTVTETDPGMRSTWARAVPFANPETVLRGYVRYNSVLEQAAKRFDVSWVPTGGFGLEGAQWYEEGDPIHFNDRGSDRMAHHMAEALLTLDLPALTHAPPH